MYKIYLTLLIIFSQARRVSGTKHSYVLWNNKGRKRAMSLICEKEDVERSRSPNSLWMQ